MVASACAHTAAPKADDARSLAGIWRAVLISPGGELPFTLRIGTDGGATIANGDERIPFSSVERHGRAAAFVMEGYDSHIGAVLSPDETEMRGEWTRQAAGSKTARLPFRARRGDERRFLELDATRSTGAHWRVHARADPAAVAAVPTVAGRWSVVFADEDGSEQAVGEFVQDGVRVTGTFLRATGDDRFLEGEYRDGLLRLSAFDGSHAFLCHALTQPDGTLRGNWWSRDTYHATFTGRRDESAVLPDAYGEVGLTNADGRLAFRFDDLDGRPVSLADERFRGKAVLVNLFGSWCPNCNDEAPLLAAWWRRYHDRGLEVVGLAYELTGDRTRDAALLRRYAARHGTPYPLLLAGTSDKRKAGEGLPDLTAVKAFPTTIFVGRDGRVRAIHSGFAGPGTGGHHARLRAEFERRIEALLAERR